ncbi:hypothetical protein F8O07_06580 [Pseudoclavibacter sp. CFCC 13796]|uniref:hypothetical protein n=1 Tax=unclassified Pseudoclavibacter TaxID=2615177 RepID=UPI001301237F|nr:MULTISPECIES: hypothetical protein [unclassified Pseudoclavibacter]KAB1661565.1 hypothetical protein F8O07_06580 [Pseudoclavibacter sp. CFCC 13796]MCD7100552.1 hypothetical protein [Pseudoclavibacter sp. 13-3]
MTEFAITIPSDWSELDVRPNTRDASITALVAKRIDENPELRPLRADLTRYLRTTARQAWDAGARYCACFAIPADGALIPGSVTVSSLPRPPRTPGTDAETAIITQIQSIKDTEDSPDTPLTLSTAVLPKAGLAPRLTGIRDMLIDHDHTIVRSLIMQTFVPAGDQIALISCASPALDLADPLTELFDTVTATLELTETADA